MSRTASRSAGDETASSPRRRRKLKLPFLADDYVSDTELPLHSLAFLLPLLILYELGTHYLSSDPMHHAQQRVLAFSWLQWMFATCHAHGRFLPYLPALAVVFMLLGMHIACKNRWRVNPRYVVGMLVESIVLSLPLLAINGVVVRYIPLAGGEWQMRSHLVLSIGAGIYEEVVFRLLMFTLLSLFLVDFLKIRAGLAVPAMVCLAALAFSAYHYLGPEAYNHRSFAFRTVAGVYFGVVFLARGFGITAGWHAFYDILATCLIALSEDS